MNTKEIKNAKLEQELNEQELDTVSGGAVKTEGQMNGILFDQENAKVL